MLCSVSVNAWQIVFSNSLYESKMGDLSDFQRGRIVDAHLTVASVNKMATLLGASRTAVSKVVTAHTNHGNASSAERNSG